MVTGRAPPGLSSRGGERRERGVAVRGWNAREVDRGFSAILRSGGAAARLVAGWSISRGFGEGRYRRAIPDRTDPYSREAQDRSDDSARALRWRFSTALLTRRGNASLRAATFDWRNATYVCADSGRRRRGGLG